MTAPALEADQQLAMAYAARVKRTLLSAVFAFDAQMKQVALANREPVFAQMRLAWWREQVFQLKQDGFAPNDPVLRDLMQFDVDPRVWSGPIDGWDAFLAGAEGDDGALLTYAAARGGEVFATLYGEGPDQTLWHQIGEGWALVDLFRTMGLPPSPDLLVAARSRLKQLQSVASTPQMRPLAIIAYLVLRDLDDVSAPASVPRRMLRALRYRFIGA